MKKKRADAGSPQADEHGGHRSIRRRGRPCVANVECYPAPVPTVNFDNPHRPHTLTLRPETARQQHASPEALTFLRAFPRLIRARLPVVLWPQKDAFSFLRFLSDTRSPLPPSLRVRPFKRPPDHASVAKSPPRRTARRPRARSRSVCRIATRPVRSGLRPGAVSAPGVHEAK